jgi:ribosomal protein S27AE
LKIPRIPRNLIPLYILLILAVGGLVVGRALLIPDTFGDYGHYRAAALDENRALEIAYAGQDVCGECHYDEYELKQQSHHRTVSCEACHGPGARHVDAPDEHTPDAPRGRGYCALCHGYNPSRPTGFPQIIPELHNPGKACMSCHDPHNPVTPHVPEECSACHRAIASEKMVSHHTSLDCQTCHEVPEDHRVSPRLAAASKPVSREFCGGCHAKGCASPREIPKIDMADHSQRYLCWDCHYPHHPEARK